MDPERHLNHSTIGKNIEALRPILAKWARSKVVAGTKADWDRAAVGEIFPEPFSDVNLWMDLSDFPIQSTAENKDWYSHKFGGTGIRVQFIMDARLRILYSSDHSSQRSLTELFGFLPHGHN